MIYKGKLRCIKDVQNYCRLIVLITICNQSSSNKNTINYLINKSNNICAINLRISKKIIRYINNK